MCACVCVCVCVCVTSVRDVVDGGGRKDCLSGPAKLHTHTFSTGLINSNIPAAG